jgi:hypothetical protein
MGLWDILTSGSKASRILETVGLIARWMTGLDARLNVIERRLGAIEYTLTMQGITLPSASGRKVKEEDKTE